MLRHLVCSKETEMIGNKIGGESVLPWCERREREREKASLFWCTHSNTNINTQVKYKERGEKDNTVLISFIW